MTRITRLTPAGTGAVATLAIEGPRAWEIARTLFQPARGSIPDTSTIGRFYLGHLGDASAADEVILTIRSIHPQPAIEIHCHGGARVVRWLMDLFIERGCVETSAIEWASHASWVRDSFGLEEVPPIPEKQIRAICADTLEALTRARTPLTAGVLLDQAHGSFTRSLAVILDALHGEQPSTAQPELDRLASMANLGRHLIEPWTVVIAGPTNVGKSSLLNAIHGYQRAIVSEIPGTTRDALRSLLSLDGLPVYLTDTAGLRETGDDLEGQGIARSRAALDAADLCIWVIDASSEPVLPDSTIREPLIVWNKCDLVASPDRSANREPIGIDVSARTGDGIGELIGAIVRRLVPTSPLPGEAVPPTAFWADRVIQARNALASGDVITARQSLLEPLE